MPLFVCWVVGLLCILILETGGSSPPGFGYSSFPTPSLDGHDLLSCKPFEPSLSKQAGVEQVDFVLAQMSVALYFYRSILDPILAQDGLRKSCSASF